MRINKITFTGADDKTDIQKLRYVSELSKSVNVEWGILFSSTTGRPRYPTDEWINELLFYSDSLNLSAHLCGQFVRELILNNNYEFLETLVEDFRRIQINVNFQTTVPDIEKLNDMFSSFPGTEFILPYSKANINFNQKLIEQKIPNLSFLYDSSGGRGVEIKEIQSPIGAHYTGYAGGLGLDNIDNIANLISNYKAEATDPSVKIFTLLAGGYPVWVDMESKLRNEKDEFDLNICKKILKVVDNRFSFSKILR